MSADDTGPVVVDTGVFGARLGRSGHALAIAYRDMLAGRPVVLSFATVAELRLGARRANWGPARFAGLDREVRRTEIEWPGPELVEAYVELRSWCVSNGHGLGQKEHEADRWIAATAIRLSVPLVAHGAIFDGVDGLELVTRLNR